MLRVLLAPGCDAVIGDFIHIFSGQWPALQFTLALAASRGIENLRSYPILQDIVTTALESESFTLIQFLSDPSCHPGLINMLQLWTTLDCSSHFV